MNTGPAGEQIVHVVASGRTEAFEAARQAYRERNGCEEAIQLSLREA